MHLLARAAARCNDAALHEKGGRWIVEADPMEGALLAFAAKAGGVEISPRKDAVPFDSRHRYMAVLTGNGMTLVKGAPERVLPMCRDRDCGPWHARAGAIADCRLAGIRMKMISGDHVGTAAAIAAQMG